MIPDGRRVVLTEERWRHMKDDHVELSRHLREVMEAVREPELRTAGRVPGEEWYFLEGVGPARWIQAKSPYTTREVRDG